MKIYIILALVALTSAEEWKRKTKDEWKQIHRACDQRYVVSEEVIEKTKNDKYPPKEAFEVVLCIFRDVEVWSDAKGFSVDRMMMAMDKVATKENIDKKFLRDSLESCADNNNEGSTALDWAYRCFKCFKDNETLFKALRDAKYFEDQGDYVDL